MLVIGDHGMTETGDHGGDSKLELETVLFFYSKKKIFNSLENIEAKVCYILFLVILRLKTEQLQSFVVFKLNSNLK